MLDQGRGKSTAAAKQAHDPLEYLADVRDVLAASASPLAEKINSRLLNVLKRPLLARVGLAGLAPGAARTAPRTAIPLAIEGKLLQGRHGSTGFAGLLVHAKNNKGPAGTPLLSLYCTSVQVLSVFFCGCFLSLFLLSLRLRLVADEAHLPKRFA